MEKGGAGLEKQLSCPKVPMTFDTFSEILKSLNVLQKKEDVVLWMPMRQLSIRDQNDTEINI